MLVARETLGLSDRMRDGFVVPLETSAYGRALVSGEIVTEELSEAWSPLGRLRLERDGWRAVMVSPLQSHRAAYGALALFFAAARRFDDEERRLCARSPSTRPSRSTTAAHAGEGRGSPCTTD